MAELYLVHHGTKGQRWGVKHGPPYPLSKQQKKAIKKEFKKTNPTDKFYAKTEKAYLSKFGVERTNKHFPYDYINKGAKVHRYSTQIEEPLDSKRKYVSITPQDKKVYAMAAEKGALGGGKKAKTYYGHEYYTTRALTVAKGEWVTKDLVKRYGDADIKEAYKLAKTTDIHKNYTKLNVDLKDSKNPNHWMYDAVAANQEKIRSFVHDILMSDKANETFERYKKKGYGAIVDIEDYNEGFEYPLIILDPKKSLREIR